MNIITAIAKRYWWALALGLVLGTLISTAFVMTNNKTTYKGLLFVTIGIDESKIRNAGDFDYYGITEGADNFTETVMGWFRSPTLSNAIMTNAELSGKEALISGFGVYKQEVQNIIVDFEANSGTAAEKIQTATMSTMEEKLSTYNRNNSAGFTFTIDKNNIETITRLGKNTIALGGIGALLLAFALCYLWELLRGRVHDRAHALSLLSTNDCLDFRGAQDVPVLSTFMASQSKHVILAGADIQMGEYVLPLTRHLSKVLHKDVILMDGNLQKRDLHAQVGLGVSMKNAKGITDFDSIQETKNFYMLDKGTRTVLQFMPAGGGEGISESFIQSLEELSDMTIFATSLPESPEILTLKNALLVLFVKPGVTKTQTLKDIALLFDGQVVMVFADHL